MSAYICDREHIIYLVNAAAWLGEHGTCQGSHFRYYHGGQWLEFRSFDPENMADAANMLWRENVRSVSARYPRESSATLPGPRGENFVITAMDFSRSFGQPDLAQVFKAADCYAYQSCETDDWEQTQAFALIQALRRDAWHALPGYDKAEWGAPNRNLRVAA